MRERELYVDRENFIVTVQREAIYITVVLAKEADFVTIKTRRMIFFWEERDCSTVCMLCREEDDCV